MLPLRSLRVLLVEDNPVNQLLASRFLEKDGHQVVIAGNGKEALLALAGTGGFDVVLMDVQMPEMDGLEATAAIRQQEQGTDRHLPIVAVTANAQDTDRDRCLEAGMDVYITKPVQSQVLRQAVAEALVSASGLTA